jgi:hypothetical protein
VIPSLVVLLRLSGRLEHLNDIQVLLDCAQGRTVQRWSFQESEGGGVVTVHSRDRTQSVASLLVRHPVDEAVWR